MQNAQILRTRLSDSRIRSDTGFPEEKQNKKYTVIIKEEFMAGDMREKYESLSLAVLRDVAKNRGIKGTTAMRKEAVIDAMLAADEKAAAAERVKAQAEETGKSVADLEQLDSGQTVTGVLEVMSDGFGFIRRSAVLA